MDVREGLEAIKPLNTVSPWTLKKRNTRVKSVSQIQCNGSTFCIKEPSAWLFIPDAMIEWNTRPSLPYLYHELYGCHRFDLPGYAAYDKKSIDKMFGEKKIVPGSDRAKKIAFFYPFNISKAGEVSEPRPWTVDLQHEWRLTLHNIYVSQKEHDKARLLILHSPVLSQSQSESTSASGKAQVSQPSPYLRPDDHPWIDTFGAFEAAKESTSSESSGGTSNARMKKLEEEVHQQRKKSPRTAATSIRRNVRPAQPREDNVGTSTTMPDISGTSVQTKSGSTSLHHGRSIPSRHIQKDQGTQACAPTEVSQAQQDQNRPVIVIVGVHDLSTVNTCAAMQQAIEILSQTMGNMQESMGSDTSYIVLSNSSMSTQARQDVRVVDGIDAASRSYTTVSHQ